MRRNSEILNRRCEKLEELGFEIDQGDSKVYVPILSGDCIAVDFSTIAEDKFHIHAINQVFGYAYELGKNNKLQEIKEALEL